MTEIPTGPGRLTGQTAPPSGTSSLDEVPGAPSWRSGEVMAPAELDPGAGPDTDQDDLDAEARDWAWVEEWREGGEPVPWGPGLALAGFALFLVASAVYVLSSGLSDHPILAIGINIIVAGGLGPALWLSRGLPVLRWIAGGAVVGVLAAWISVFIFLT